MKFTKEDIGKTVRVKSGEDTLMYHIKEGVICHESHKSIGNLLWIGIDVGEENGLHDCKGSCSNGCGIWVYEEDFEII